MLEIGVTVLVRLMVWFALVHLCLTLGSLWSWFILVVLFNSVVYADYSLDSWIVVWWWFAYYFSWFWCSGDVIVIHWLTNEVTLVAGWCWVNRETRIRSDWGGGCFIWLWFMEFGVTVWLWLCRRFAGRGSWYYWCSSVVRLSWFSTLIEVCDGWLIRCLFDFGWWGVWLVVMMNDEWWFVVSVIDGSLFRLRFTCYLLPMFFDSLCDSG